MDCILSRIENTSSCLPEYRFSHRFSRLFYQHYSVPSYQEATPHSQNGQTREKNSLPEFHSLFVFVPHCVYSWVLEALHLVHNLHTEHCYNYFKSAIAKCSKKCSKKLNNIIQSFKEMCTSNSLDALGSLLALDPSAWWCWLFSWYGASERIYSFSQLLYLGC